MWWLAGGRFLSRDCLWVPYSALGVGHYAANAALQQGVGLNGPCQAQGSDGGGWFHPDSHQSTYIGITYLWRGREGALCPRVLQGEVELNGTCGDSMKTVVVEHRSAMGQWAELWGAGK